MNSKYFKLISVLLTAAFVCLAIIQFIWVKTIISNSKIEFKRQFTEALSNTSKELQRIEDTKRLRTNIAERIKMFDINNSVNNISVSSSTQKNTLGKKLKDTSFTIIQIDSSISHNQKKIIIKKINNYGEGSFTDSTFTHFTFNDANTKIKGRMQNLDTLLNKMILEFEHKELDIKDRTNVKMIKEVLGAELKKKGLSIDFEFSVTNDKNKVLMQSTGFKEGDSYAIMPLFMQDVFRKKSFLSAYPINLNSYLWNNLKTPLLLSAIFSLIVLILFIITFKAILKQKKLSEMKNDFINNITHELKTPISTISIAADALKNPLVNTNPETILNYANILKEENNRLNQHVEKVLQISLLEKNETKGNFKKVNLSELLQKSVQSFKLKAEQQNAIINFTTENSSTCIYGDEYSLSNTFNNIIDNALKYSKENCKLNIQINESSDKIKIHFTDNGIGINKNDLQKIFDKFYRINKGNLHDVKGFGLGLSYCKLIIEQHGGSIAVKSEPGIGSEFIIELNKT